ncbi:MAG: Nitrilase/cyanide hydratase and apolipoprotein N-acyltransferase [Candidatus Saccharibacteria bacterium]|nr:Nitrilase/cyanide hydratase and apolipoprotein N-acyltransferase [Candidatus Saccharibacteria bacterium]
MTVRIGTFQLHDIQGDMERSLKVIETCLSEADDAELSVVCFPECFLQGYTLDVDETKERAINLNSDTFHVILRRLAGYKSAFILGMIEQEGDSFYNTAVVVYGGRLVGRYRKVHLFEPNFTAGTEYPVFSIGDLTFGVNICYDARFPEGAVALAKKGAQAIFYPLNNRLSREKAIGYREKHSPHLIDRASDTGCWVVSSDVVADDAITLGYGCSVIVNAKGELQVRVPELTAGMVAVEKL